MGSPNTVAYQAKGLDDYVARGDFSVPYGLQWGAPALYDRDGLIPTRYIWPLLRLGATAIEIGSGGGRWSRWLWERAIDLILVDGTPSCEAAIRGAFPGKVPPGVRFIVSPDGKLPDVPDASLDYAFSFDTFIHFPEALFRAYVEEIGRCLRPGAPFALHYCSDPETDTESGKAAFHGFAIETVERWLSQAGILPLSPPYDFIGHGKAVRSRVQGFARR